MKWPWMLWAGALLLTGAAKAPPGGARTAATIQISGRSYVRLADWAKGRNFDLRWDKREETLHVISPSVRISLAVDSQESSFNGVAVRLLFPAVLREGQAWVSDLDLRYTFDPVLTGSNGRVAPAIRSICLDPGHGGRDPGNQVKGYQEKKYNLLLAEELRAQLVKAGFKVSLTRTADKFIDLEERPAIARRRNCDLFVCLHFNAFAQPSVRGAEVYCMTPAGAPSSNARGEGASTGAFSGNRLNSQNMQLAYEIQKSLTRNLGVEDRGVHRARFAVLRDAPMPAVLIEGGFMTNPIEGRKIFEPGYRRQMARAIVDGILAYKRRVE